MIGTARHQCFVYDGPPSAHLADISRTLLQKLAAQRRCLYLNSPPMVAGMRCHLAAAGLDLDEEQEKGALVLTSDQDHLVDGEFDVDRMIHLLEEATEQARADGFAGLWASGDMSWEFGRAANLHKLEEYERRLEDFIVSHESLSGICLYHRATLPSHAIETALITHPSLYYGASLSRLNRRYYQHLKRE